MKLSEYLKMIECAQQEAKQDGKKDALEKLRISLIGKNGEITNAIKNIALLSNEEKRKAGKELNELKNAVEDALKNAFKNIEEKPLKEQIDYTLPINIRIGKRHIISESIEKLQNFFAKQGFNFAEGPDIEEIYYNFEALTINESHPSRDNNDTFYIGHKILRTQTTAVQIRVMEMLKNKSQSASYSERFYTIGRVYRNDSHDSTHASSFHQVEGIIIEKDVTLEHLKGFLEEMIFEFFGKKAKLRFRPSYFPFTEPSCEVDVFTKKENGKLEILDSTNGKAIELGGCGIIHPSILQKFNQTEDNNLPKQAFAFGFGLERMIMMKHNLPNLHTLYKNNMRILERL